MNNSEITSETLFQIFILGVLVKSGGSASTQKVINIIREVYGDKLSKKDLMDFEISKEVRWENNVRRARQHLVKEGCLKQDFRRGIWEITNMGREQHKKWIKMMK